MWTGNINLSYSTRCHMLAALKCTAHTTEHKRGCAASGERERCAAAGCRARGGAGGAGVPRAVHSRRTPHEATLDESCAPWLVYSFGLWPLRRGRPPAPACVAARRKTRYMCTKSRPLGWHPCMYLEQAPGAAPSCRRTSRVSLCEPAALAAFRGARQRMG